MIEIVFDSSVDSDILKNQQPKINYKKLLLHLKLKLDAFLFKSILLYTSFITLNWAYLLCEVEIQVLIT